MIRVEDQRLITGAGAFTDDTLAEGALWGVFVRAPHAHAEILGMDRRAAMTCPGARLVLDGKDWRAAGLGSIPMQQRLVDAEGRPPREAPWSVLADGRVRHVG